MGISREITGKLYDAAVKARMNSCSPYSEFKVGAAIVTQGGKIFSGCNIESSSFGLTMCAERNALSAALCAGERDFSAVLVVADTDRQLIYDYAPDITVIMANLKTETLDMKIKDMLKYPFGPCKS